MARKQKVELNADSMSAEVLPDGMQDKRVTVNEATRPEKNSDDELVAWVTNRLTDWKTFRYSNYDQDWDEYERLWRGIYSAAERQRQSERNTLITPALSEAVENSVAEIEEAVFGRGGDFLDITAQAGDSDEEVEATEKNKVRLKEDLNNTGFSFAVSECLLNGAVYGTGIGEIVMKEFTLRDMVAAVNQVYGGEPEAPAAAPLPEMGSGLPEMGTTVPEMGTTVPEMGTPPAGMPGMPPMGQMPAAPSMHQMPDGSMMPDGAMQPPMAKPAAPARKLEKKVKYACLRSVNPRNFLIDPNARTVDDALGCAVEEFIGTHLLKEGIEAGEYNKVELDPSAAGSDYEITPDPQVIDEYSNGKSHVYRYYGLVPERLLFPPENTEDLKADKGDEPGVAKMVEAVIVIVNQNQLLKAVENDFFMMDRSVVAFPWDIVPGRFWGRGICEKGRTPQKMLDAELRYRMDALAYTSAPMMGMDASRLPPGFQFKVHPGKSILTNGDPATVLKPFKFGEVDQNTWQQAEALDKMVQRATGSLDGVAMAQSGVGGQARSGAVSMSLTGIVKRHRRTLMNVLDRFLKPAAEKILWRNMQYNPDRYTALNYTMNVTGTMGIMQREYESQALAQAAQSLQPGTQEQRLVIAGIIQNTGLSSRHEIVQLLKQPPPSPEAQIPPELQALQTELGQMQAKLAIAQAQLDLAKTEAEIAKLQADTMLVQAKVLTEQVQPEVQTTEVMLKGIYQTPEEQVQAEFDRRVQMAQLMQNDEDIKSNERITQMQTQAKHDETRTKAAVEAHKANVDAAARTREAEAQERTAQISATSAQVTQ